MIDDRCAEFMQCPRCGTNSFVYIPWLKHGECLQCGFNRKPAEFLMNKLEPESKGIMD